ncbi:MAG TPA: protein kinase [Candidatus Polarisedimenticolia bacterium]|nr:protein kinase [Candidatus Polarisedimenticolia bacterium]
MPLDNGQRLGAYEIVEPIGAGGMGEVYRANDSRLRRQVAIKVLPAAFAAEADRLARFEREAQVLASLNHPNIAAIYGLEVAGPTRCLVLELVEGATLAERIARGPMPIEEALPAALQIAAGLEAAHEKGIIHRDLKPANIKVTPEGMVKVLDFGLAKAFDDGSGFVQDGTLSPTLTMAATRAGVIVGTSAYMSPEQARGKPADRRADIWAFGIVLFEMLSGSQLFRGESISETLAAVLMTEPAWERLPSDVPASIVRLLRRCLERDPLRRLRDIGEARIAIADCLTHPSGPGEPGGAAGAGAHAGAGSARGRLTARWAATVVGLLAVALIWIMARSPKTAPPGPLHLSINLPADEPLHDNGLLVAIAPGGDALVMVTSTPKGSRLARRRFDRPGLEPIAGTDGATTPVFSPDGRWVAFTASGKLRKVPLDGGSPQDLCAAAWGGGSWGEDGAIIFTPTYIGGLWRVRDSGGQPESLTRPDPARGELGHWWPRHLPDGRHVLFTAYSTPVEKSRIEVLSIDSGERKPLIEGGTFARYVPTGHIVFLKSSTLLAVPFDPERLEVTGPPVAVLEDLPLDTQDGNSQFDFSRDGTLAYVPASSLDIPSALVWVNTDRSTEPIVPHPHHYAEPRIAPDGRRLAVTIFEENLDLWVLDRDTGIRSRLTFGPTGDFNAHWTPDGAFVVYNVEDLVFDIYRARADGGGEPEPLLKGGHDKVVSSISSDGRLLAYSDRDPATSGDIWLLPLEGDRKPQLFLRTPFDERNAAFSPDGRWLAYSSNESGDGEIYVQAFPAGGGKRRISDDGGDTPRWGRNSDRLYYRSGKRIMAVEFDTSAGLAKGRPRSLFEGDIAAPFGASSFDVSPDGRLAVVLRPAGAAPRQVNIMLNWFEDLRRKAPGAR